MRLYNFGSLNVDYVYRVPHFLQPGETLSSESRTVYPGGKGLNQSVAAARAGLTVLHGGAVGADGRFLLHILEEAGVQTEHILCSDEPGGHTVIQVDDTGQNCILLYPGTNHMLTAEYLRDYLADAQPGDVLLLQNETNALCEAMELAVQKQMVIALNPSPISAALDLLPLEKVTWWFCNEIEVNALFGSDNPEEIAQIFTRRYPDSHLVLTLGEQGSMLIDSQQVVRQPAFSVTAVDTTAAGDTFTGYFLSEMMQGHSGAQALYTAAKAAAIAVSRAGAAVSIPTAQEVAESTLK